MSSCLYRFSQVSLTLACIVSLGCQAEEPVTNYSVARTAPPRPPLDAEEILQQLDHVLVAIVPHDDKAWFFKLVGTAPAIKRQRQSFYDFLATVKMADTSSDAPSWKLPDGWAERQAAATPAVPSALRAATLLVPDAAGDLELSVSSLPLTENWEEFLVPNVNRWLGQLQQNSLPAATILKLARLKPTHDRTTTATIFELSGTMSARPPGGNADAGTGTAPAATAAAETPATGSPPTEKSLTYKMPVDWRPGKLSMMRKAAFLLPDGQPSDEVTVMSFPAAEGTQMADVAANVRRWAGQVGMALPTSGELGQLVEPITISGIAGSYVELMSPAESTRSVALLAAMIKHDGQVWFFKMVGERNLVSSQRGAFREFLRSVRFP